MKDIIWETGKNYVLIVYVLIPMAFLSWIIIKWVWRNIFVYLYEEAKKEIKNLE